jgi:hypothetical protein
MQTSSTQLDQDYQEAIALMARELWEKDGRQPNRDLDYWLEAEKQVLTQRKTGAVSTNIGKARSRAPVSKSANKAIGNGEISLEPRRGAPGKSNRRINAVRQPFSTAA